MKNFEIMVQQMFGVIPEGQEELDIPSWPNEDDEYIVEYMTHVFENATYISSKYSETQIYRGLIFLNSSQSDAMFSLVEESVSWNKRKKCIQSMRKMFEGLSLNSHFKETSSTYEAPSGTIDNACQFWFECMPIHGNPNSPIRDKELVDPEFLFLLENILNIDSEICRASALLGLDSWRLYYPARVMKILDEFLLKESSQNSKDYAILVRSRIKL